MVKPFKTLRVQAPFITPRWTYPHEIGLVTAGTVSGATHREAPHLLLSTMQCRFPVLILFVARNGRVSRKSDPHHDQWQYFILYKANLLSPSFPQAVEKRVRDAAPKGIEFKSVEQIDQLLTVC